MSEETTDYVCAFSSIVQVVRQEISDSRHCILVDIPANFDLGKGVRREIARLHQATTSLDSLFGKGVSMGNVLFVDFRDDKTRYVRTVFYIICRLKLQDEFDFSSYKTALTKVRTIAENKGIRFIDTIKVPFYRDVAAYEIRDALTNTFATSNITLRLCVGRDDHI